MSPVNLGPAKRHDDKPPVPGKPPKPPKEKPPKDVPPGSGLPTGSIQAQNPFGASFGLDWGPITRWQKEVDAASAEFGVPAPRLYAHIVIESGGDPRAIQKNSAGWSYGLMQVVPRWWRDAISELAGVTFRGTDDAGTAMLNDPLLAVRAGAYVLKVGKDACGTWDGASSDFFTGTCTWAGSDSVNGTTGAGYQASLDALIAEIEHVAPGPPPKPHPPTDPLRTIIGGDYTIYQDFAAYGGPDLYDYGRGHGLDGKQHTGVDMGPASGAVLGATCYTPGAGVVTCAGTGVGAGSWATGCAAFGDTYGNGTGRVEVLLDSGVSVIFGHSSDALVGVGDRVTLGQPVTHIGGAGSGPHVHLETRIWQNGNYLIVDPRKALGGTVGANTVPYVWDAPNRNLFLVTPLQPTAAFQRADPAATKLYDIAPREVQEAVAIVPGEDKEEWWLLTNDARMPMTATTYKVKIG